MIESAITLVGACICVCLMILIYISYKEGSESMPFSIAAFILFGAFIFLTPSYLEFKFEEYEEYIEEHSYKTDINKEELEKKVFELTEELQEVQSQLEEL